MKKIFLGLMLFIFSVVGTVGLSSAQHPRTDELFNSQFLGEAPKLNDYTAPDVTSQFCHLIGSGGEFQFCSLVDTILNYLKKILIPSLVLVLTWAGMELFLARGQEDVLTNKKNEVLAIAVGFGLILLSAVLVERVLFGTSGEILRLGNSDAFAARGVSEIWGIIHYILTFVVIIAIGFIIFTVFQLIFGEGDDDEIADLKKQVIYACLGIVVIVVSGFVIEFFAANQKMINSPTEFGAIISTFTRWTNIVLSFVGILAVIALVWGGIRLVASFGDEAAMESAKKIMIYAAVALVLAFSAYTLMRFFILPMG